jgi:hypothetical protein
MELSVDMTLLEQMKEGIILLNRFGQITDFNSAAGPWLKQTLAAQATLGQRIIGTINTNTRFPVAISDFEPTDGPFGELKVYLCSNGSSGYALLFARLACPPGYVSREDVLSGFSLLGQEIRHELTQLREQLLMAGEQSAVTPQQHSLAFRADRLSRLFVAIDQLSRLGEMNTFSKRKQLSMADLMDAVLDDIGPGQARFLIHHVSGSPGGLLEAVYGDADWLKCGLRSLFDGLAESGPSQSQIELTLRQRGSFLVLTGGFGSTGERGHNRPPQAVDATQVSMTLVKDIRTPIARRIFELHGGQLTTEATDPGDPDQFQPGIASFSLTLPTGLAAMQQDPPRCDGCAQTLQAEAYARDLAFLLQGHPARTEVSPAEVEMLLQTFQL